MPNDSGMQADLVAALGIVQNPPKVGTANYGQYATLEGCLAVVKAALARHNLGVVQMVCPDPDRLVTRIVHASGESIEDGGVPLHCENQSNPQKMGSAITYARRYGLCAMLGIVGEDDDDAQFATPVEQLPAARRVPFTDQKLPEPRAPRVVADDIPFNKTDEKTDWTSWVDDQIAGMDKHLTTVEHRRWSRTIKSDRERLEREDPQLHAVLQDAYELRKAELENRS